MYCRVLYSCTENAAGLIFLSKANFRPNIHESFKKVLSKYMKSKLDDTAETCFTNTEEKMGHATFHPAYTCTTESITLYSRIRRQIVD